MTFQATLALVVLSLSAWSALALLLDARGPAAVNRRFSALILLFCIPQAYFYTQLLTPAPEAFMLGLAAQAAIWLKGPLLLSMTRLVVGRPMARESLHFMAFPPAFIGMWFTPQWAMEWGLAGFSAMFVYLLVALRDLKRARSRLAMIQSGFPNSSYYWLMFLVAGLLMLVTVDLAIMAVAYTRGKFPVDFIKVVNWLVAGYFIVIAFCSVYRPRVFFHEEKAADESVIGGTRPEKAWRELDDSLAEGLARRLGELRERDQLFRQHDLSLADLAGRLGISTHQASELLNVHFGQPFYEYLNGWRLWHACQLLADPRCKLRVLDIAFEAGFGNKNSFYRSFREAYAMTPVQFRGRSLETRGGRAPAATLATQSQNPS